MDSLIASTPTYGWELLAQLAAWGQQGMVSTDPSTCAGELADLLARHLPMPDGRIEIIEHGAILGSATWGRHSGDRASARLSIRADGDEIGCLYLGGDSAAALDPNIAIALTAQLALLLATRRREAEIAVIGQLRALIASTLESVGVLDVRTLLSAVLSEALPILNVESAGIYSGDDDGQALALTATSASADGYPQLIAHDSEDLPARAAARGEPQIGSALVATSRRRGAAGTARATERPALAIPLLFHQQSAGVLVAALHASAPEPDSSQVRLIESFAEQLALLLRNARLFSQQQQRARELFVLYENSKEISTGAQIESTLDRATENIALALDAEHCAVRLIEPQRPDVLRTVAIYAENGRTHASASDIAIVNAPSFLAQISRGEPLQIEDVAAPAA
ncbi:MAG: GAF domain-containing protein, partial [Chloroflexales bacterium]